MERRFWRPSCYFGCTDRNWRHGTFSYAHIMATIPMMTAITLRLKMYRVILCILAVSRSVLLAVFKAKASGILRPIFNINSGHFLSLLSLRKNLEFTAHISDLSLEPSPINTRRSYPFSMIFLSCKRLKVPKKSSILRSFSRVPWLNITFNAQILHLSSLILLSPNG